MSYKYAYLVVALCIGSIILCFKTDNRKQKQKISKMYTFLALGDSYTIGEQVHVPESFPYQTVKRLKERKMEVTDPVIVAKTGWTTDELDEAIREHNIDEQFSFVSLLIGVNNQYRGRDAENYKREFTLLLTEAIAFAGNKPEHVFVLSIPDWGVTPFAEGRDRRQIAKEIDMFNAINRQQTLEKKCHYIEITGSTRDNGVNKDYLAEDGLHPSAKEYAIWAEKLANEVEKTFKNQPVGELR
jgi:lysophospholipase L1-like esterase